MSLVVVGDFTCPECYLASRRADVLAAAGVAIEWRAVEHRPRLPINGVPLGADGQADLDQRFATLDDLLLPGERLPWTPPRLVAKSEAAVSAYAEAVGAGVDAEVRRLLFELYWLDGADIGSPTVLRTPLAAAIRRGNSTVDALRYSGFAVSVDRGPITTEALARIRGWRGWWRELGSPALPIVLAGGATLTGIDALRRLGKEIGYAGADPAAGSEVPAPDVSAVRVHPGPRWTSWIGDPWRTANRSAPAR
jgi:hypothetical protein